MRCQANHEIFVNETCYLKAVNKYKVFANIQADIVKEITELTVTLRSYTRLNGWKPWIIAGTMDICSILAGKFNPIFKMVKNVLNKTTNINHTCPYSGRIIGKNMELEHLNFGGSILPRGIYRFVFTGYREVFYFNLTLDFEVVKKSSSLSTYRNNICF
ncbi:uncharacterized protein LOC129619214 [Condylostylus longicornis]|uniref:uncharacterized protein LOC129619214 n=1 Tax=Condylostylus longicornis TaxID=2530218 RepID=UPI00244E3D22|nr:uncharacterized protein LOC129619214 [Condylostylus longicornis]